MVTALEIWGNLGSVMAAVMFALAMFKQYFPPQLCMHIESYGRKAVGHVYPYVQIKFPEFTGERLERCEVFTAIQNYLSGSASTRAKRLKAESVKDSQSLVLSMDENEEVVDEFQGVKLWWSSSLIVPQKPTFSVYPSSEDKRFYKLTFHRSQRELITGSYIKHVLEKGKAVEADNRQRKLYTNNPSSNWGSYKASKWSHVAFKHPSTFDTLAMEPSKKREIMNDLLKFRRGKEYYERIGRAWKRGYLLYGPPGTGKFTMIAAMANFLNYDVYDLELTTVKDNTELRKLLIETSEKSIIVIEDIDCSLELTSQRKTKKQEKEDPVKKMKGGEESKESKVTLSGLLNFIDGLWSACGGERIIVFTTNFVEKLDPALIRRGRMDKHIKMSYCCFESFKVLARNYLGLELHPLFTTVRRLLEETEMTPADVAENLMPKSDDEDEDACLEGLIEALEKAKEDAGKKSEEEEEAAAAEAEATAVAEEEEQQTLSEGEQENGRRGCAKEGKENGLH
ncbi:AAA-ATPase ASD, mitochondrial-like isoform X3 [Rhodamnia argentea]|uniref:AAA-ATPase ASD, mitochondrial-like isoform X3 n=1 Tax=Rhodamnia argentea TaxID=178133 RepID=A0A8B8P7M9_9MYRT|nr:AAA-ATPase ASD, mitochondrial-like isoform X3 [Rhodamnia argentea]